MTFDSSVVAIVPLFKLLKFFFKILFTTNALSALIDRHSTVYNIIGGKFNRRRILRSHCPSHAGPDVWCTISLRSTEYYYV